MASIRRTLSPSHQDRSYLNGSISPPLKQTNQTFFFKFRRFFLRISRRNSPHSFTRHFFQRILLFFFLGIFLGILPFGHISIEDDTITNPNDFGFEFDKRPKEGRVVADVDVRIDDLVLATKFDYKPRKLLIIVTPTYNRVLQGYYLSRLSQVLRLVNPPVMWIVVEMGAQSTETGELLRKTGVMYRHLVCDKNLTDIKDRGVQQRNTAIEHIRVHRLDGVVYFADDDNVYSLELFERIRDISRFGTWPVAMLAQSKNKAILEGPVCDRRKVIGWHTNEKSKRLRRFHVDMSGFAFNSTILWDPKRWNRPFLDPIRQLDTVKEGFQETTFIEQLVADESQMEGIPDGCGKIMNWHLHLDAHGVSYPRGWLVKKNLDAVVSID